MSGISKVVPDQAARDRALSPESSFIVQAPAGSGKTELLSQRVLKLLANVQAPEEVIAITFTRKAAREMRNRILDALRAAGGAEPESSHRRLTWRLAGQVMMRDRELGWGLLQSPDRLRIQTIDALCSSLSAQMPVLTRFGANVSICEEPAELYRAAALDLVMEIRSREATPGLALLLAHLDNQVPKCVELIANMLAKRDQWLRLTGGGESALSREALEQGLRDLVESRLQAAANEFNRAERERLMGLVHFAGAHLAPDAELAALRDLVDFPTADADSLPAWQALAHFCLTKSKATLRKSANAGLGFPAQGAAQGADQKALFKERKAAFSELMADFGDRAAVATCLEEVRRLPLAVYDEEQWQLIEALLALLPQAAARLMLQFREAGQVDFVEMALAANRALGEPDEPTDLALKLDYQISHLLVDEFQDTSYSQFHLLEKLTAGWQPDDGRTLFLVGDPMQSIYRFREANVGLFLTAKNDGIGDIQPEFLALQTNFRSTPAIVDWINQAFAQIFPAREDPLAGAIALSPAVAFQSPAADSGVTMHAFAAEQRAQQADRVRALTQAALARDPDGSIAILVRSRTQAVALVEQLKLAGISHQAVDMEPLGERAPVRDLVSLARVLLHPGDTIAAIAILKAPWCGLSLADITRIHGVFGDNWLGALMNAGAAADWGLSEVGQARLQRLAGPVVEQLGRRGRESLARQLERLWLQLGGPACLDEGRDLEDARTMLDKLRDLESSAPVTEAEQLEQAIAGLYARPDPEASDQVQIMSIHKSKGLEFDTVILPGLGSRTRGDDHQLLAWEEVPASKGGTDYLLAPMAGAASEDSVYTLIRDLQQQKARLEDARLLYVAATRAKKHLHLLGHTAFRDAGGEWHPAKPTSGSLLELLMPVVSDAFVRLAGTYEPAAEDDQEQVIDGSWYRLPDDWQRPVVEDKSFAGLARPTLPAMAEKPEYDWAGSAAPLVGTLVHRYLELIAGQGPEAWDQDRIRSLQPVWRNFLQAGGIQGEALEQALARIAEALGNALSCPEGRWILSADRQEAFSEFALIAGAETGHQKKVLDRTFVDEEGVRWIIDYKTSVHEGGNLEAFLDNEAARYQPQLAGYAELFRKLESRPVRAALYFPLQKKLKEVEV